MSEYSEVRYLLAKRTVDDRALHRGVLDALARALAERPAPPRVLEIGAGAGTMLPRLLAWGVLERGEYTLVDRDGVALEAARERLQATRDEARRAGESLHVSFEHADALELCERPERARSFDLVIANAVLDLVDVRAALPRLWRALVPGGLFWFSINFDGETIFVPELPLDGLVTHLYHRTMDERVRDGQRAGDSRTGRHLLLELPASGARLLAAGSSDWVVFPTDGGYPSDEAYFLHHIVHTIERALSGHAELDAAGFAAWIAERHAQIEQGTLCYVAHQLDVFGRGPR